MTANNGGGPPNALAVSNVQASVATTTGFQVSWATNIAANSSVDYGTTASYGTTTPVNSTMVTSHQASLTGLTKGTLYHFRVRSTDANNDSSTSGDTTFATLGDTTPPTVSITSPAANATLSGTASLTASASDNVAVASVQFKVDNANTGMAITAAPYSYSLNTATLSNGNHVITAVAADTSGNTATSAQVAVKVSNTADTTPPTVSITAPTSGATVSGTVSVAANASDNVGVASVQFQLDGANFGSLDTAAPYSVTWNTTTSSNGSHSLRAVAKDAAGNSATSANVTVTVSNGAPDTTPPSIPAGLSATAISSSQINLSWTASTDNVGVSGYNVYRGGTKIGTAPGTSYQDSGLAASTSYSYNVSAFDAAGNTSAQSSGASATTLAATSGGGIPSALGWYQIPNSKIRPLCPSYPEIQAVQGCPAVMTNWSGGLFDTKRNRLIIHGGGHTGYFGNELYAVDLSANPIAPVLVHDATHGSSLTAPGSCSEANADGTPNSRHTYSGLVYINSLDKYLVYGGSKANCGFFSNGMWEFSPATNSWAQISQQGSAQPNPAGNGSTPLLAYDSVTDAVYYSEVNGANFWQFNVQTNTWAKLHSWGSSPCPTLNTSADIDVSRRNYVCIGTGTLWKISLNSPYTATSLTGTGCSGILNAPGGSPGWAYYPSTRNFIGWAGGNTVYIYNPDSDSCTTQTYAGGPTTIQSLGTYGRFRYSPALDVFVVANSIDDFAYTLRLTAGGGTPSGPVISGIGVNGISTTGATISWTTDVAASSQVEYGTTTAYGTLTTLNSSLLTAHAVALTGLSAGTLYHYRVRSKNSGGVESISADAAFSTNSTIDTTPPAVSLTAPASGATVSGTVTVSATASDNVGVASVQFTVDGVNTGSALTASPYQVSWDTTTSTNGPHTLSAVARDAAGNVGNAAGVSVTVSNSTSTALQNFQTRCAQTGVIVCQGFDDPAIFTPAKFPASGIYVGASAAYASYDSTVSASGSGSLRFTIPSLAGPGDSGYWRQLMSSNLSAGPSGATMFGPNSTFYVQFRQRFSPEFLTNQWPANGGGTTWWKQEIFSNDASTCGQVELTTVNEYNRGYPMMYSQCGADSFQVNLNNGDFLNEQGDTSTTGYNCHYQSANNVPGSCFLYPSNTWVTFYYKVSIGNWGQPNSSIQAWVSVGGQPYKEWINMTNHILNEDTAGADYNMVTLLPYMTQRNSSVSAGPIAYTWYDELIVSASPIAAPNN